MYDKKFWNNVYDNNVTPWMRGDFPQIMIECVRGYVLSGAENVLDYGCGNGFVADYIRKNGAVVDLAEISDALISKLQEWYPRVNVYPVQTPSDVPHHNYYDCVLCLNVLHHVKPEIWSKFLDELHTLLKPGGRLIVSGWDDTDYWLRENKNIALATNSFSWPITSLSENISLAKWDIIDNTVHNFSYGEFETRAMRFYCLVAK